MTTRHETDPAYALPMQVRATVIRALLDRYPGATYDAPIPADPENIDQRWYVKMTFPDQDGGAGGFQQIAYLHNAITRVGNGEEPELVVADLLRPIPDLATLRRPYRPTTWAEARPQLRLFLGPHYRDDLPDNGTGLRPIARLSLPWDYEGLFLYPVLDRPDAFQFVMAEMLAEWGVSTRKLYRLALRQTRRALAPLPPTEEAELPSGVRVRFWQHAPDAFTATRLLFPELLLGRARGATETVMIGAPDRESLIVVTTPDYNPALAVLGAGILTRAIELRLGQPYQLLGPDVFFLRRDGGYAPVLRKRRGAAELAARDAALAE